MTWYHTLLLTAVALFITVIVFVAPFILCYFIDRVIESIRRKRHPEYFKLYDIAIKESFSVGEEFNRRYDPIKFQFRMWTDGLKNGECTDEDFSKQMTKLTEEYRELCCWYTVASQYINDLWQQVDLKAKEESFKWGVIYGNKSKEST